MREHDIGSNLFSFLHMFFFLSFCRQEIFTGQYEDVGLMTGDVILNPNAPCLIMTTEILRNMLYNGSETLAETSVVIFDEIHYMKDVERGIIWEESIIMLPPHIQCVFLSATLSNAEEFAEWIHEIKAESIKEQEQQARGGHQNDNDHHRMVDALTTLLPSSSSSQSHSKYHSAVCHVVYTNYRPIPLMHYLFLKGGSGLYQIKNDAKLGAARATPSSVNTGANMLADINMNSLRKIQAEIQELAASKKTVADLVRQQHSFNSSSSSSTASSSPSPTSTPSHSHSHSHSHAQRIQDALAASRLAKRAEIPDLVRLVTLAVEQDWLPLLIFSFSRRECEALSLVLTDRKWKLDLTSSDEKEMIQLVWDRAMEGLQEADRHLPQLEYILPMLRRGFGVHHSGLLPLVKEVIEILFQEGLVKALLCTETFAMGINVPARTVVFTSVEKFDGRSMRYLHSSEYTQMAGRAGRRGQDTKGIVIIMVGSKEIEASAALKAVAFGTALKKDGNELGGMLRQLLTGTAEPLQSKFRLTYNMILNLIRCSSSFDPTYILSKSFLHFQQKHLHQFRRASSNQSAIGGASRSTSSITGVSGRRARMGEGGLARSYLEAGGDELWTKQTQAKTQLEELKDELNAIEDDIDELKVTQEQQQSITTFQSSYRRMVELRHREYEYALRHPLSCMLPYLDSGRLVYVRSPRVPGRTTTASQEGRPEIAAQDWGWGIVIHWRKRHASTKMEVKEEKNANGDALPALYHHAEYVVDVLLPVGMRATGAGGTGAGTDAWTEAFDKWGEVIVPRPPEVLTPGAQAWENGRWDEMMKTNKDESETSSTSSSSSATAPLLYHIVNCSLPMIHSISSVRLYLPSSLVLAPSPTLSHPQELRRALFKVLENVSHNFFDQCFPKLGFRDWLKPSRTEQGGNGNSINSMSLTPFAACFDGTQIQKKYQHDYDEIGLVSRELLQLERRLIAQSSLILSSSSSPSSLLSSSIPLATVRTYLHLASERARIMSLMSSHGSTLSTTYLTAYRIELKTRLRILRRFKHLSSEGLITAKGRIAAEIECTDELLITEFIYEGHWTPLSTPELIAILTCFLEIERSSARELRIPTPALEHAFAELQALAGQICDASNECGLIIDRTRYTDSFKSDLILITYTWLTRPNCTFEYLLTLSDLFEGSLIRMFRRLDELLNQLMKAATNIGEMTLHEKLAEGQKMMKKGIMFAGSLYI